MTRPRFAWACTLAFASICTFGQSSAHADTASSAAAARKAASERYHRGIELYKHATQTHDAADFERAYLEFAQAYSIYPDDKVLWNLAASELETKRFLAALRHFRTYDAHLHVSDNGQAPDHAKLATYLNRAYGATGHLDIKAPDGAHLSIDGTDTGVAPLADVVDVEEGTHKVASDGETRDVAAAGGQLVKVVFTGNASATPATTNAPPAATSNAVQAASTNGQSSVPPETTSRGSSVPLGAWILGGAGIAALGVGIGFAVDAGSKNDTVSSANASGACVDPGSASCTNAQDAKSTRDRDHVIEGVAFAAGGAALVGGVLWGILGRHSSSDTAFLVPDFGVGRAGLRASVTF